MGGPQQATAGFSRGKPLAHFGLICLARFGNGPGPRDWRISAGGLYLGLRRWPDWFAGFCVCQRGSPRNAYEQPSRLRPAVTSAGSRSWQQSRKNPGANNVVNEPIASAPGPSQNPNAKTPQPYLFFPHPAMLSMSFRISSRWLCRHGTVGNKSGASRKNYRSPAQKPTRVQRKNL